MSITQTALMQQRRDTAANWTSANPTLLAGEIGIESDTNKLKLGTGSTAWTALGYTPWSQVSAYPFVNADIAAAAGIAYSKLATLTSGNIVLGSSANVATSTAVTGDVTISNTGVTAIAAGVIVDADINASAAIVDTKLATIATAGKVSNSATTATSANTASAIVARDASGNFTAGTITAALTGAASSNVLKAGDTMTGALVHPLGAAATPSLTFTGDLNTGIYSPGADQVAVATNGTGRLFVDASGNVGVGISSPAGELQVSSADGTTDFFLTEGSSPSSHRIRNVGSILRVDADVSNTGANSAILLAVDGAECLRITASGLVGIGNSSPGTYLDTRGFASYRGNAFAIASFAANNTLAPLNICQSENGTAPAISAGQNSSSVYQPLVLMTSEQKRVLIDPAGNVGIGDIGPDSTLTIKAATSVTPLRVSGPSSEFARIDSSGRLLVGTSASITAVTFPAQVQSNSFYSYSASLFSADASGSNFFFLKSRNPTTGSHTVVQQNDVLGQLQFAGSDGTAFISGAGIAAAVDGTPGANDMPGRLVFSTTADGASSPTERMRINSAGNIITTGTFVDPAITGTILEDIFTITDAAAFEVDPGNGSIQLITLGASRTPKATNMVAGEAVTLMVNDGTAYTLTWTDATWGTGGVKWTGGSAPTLATTGFTVLQFWKVSTQVYGAYVGDVA